MNDAYNPQDALRQRLREDGAPRMLIDTFLLLYEKLAGGHSALLPEDAIAPPSKVAQHGDAAPHASAGAGALGRTVFVKLNGGLGTGMGLQQAKSLLKVKDGLTFLELIARQVLRLREDHGAAVPLVLMNSAATESDTLAALESFPELAAGQGDVPLSFLQHRVPKIDRETLGPVDWPRDPELTWCPPGHGDIYNALVTRGVLTTLLEQGYRYAFVSNADNLGATLDLAILGYVASRETPFLMEVTERTEADRKGGHLAEADGRLLLREVAQCPKDDLDHFQDITLYRYFNTNNLWINLRALDALIREKGVLELPVIFNEKTVDPRDPASRPVVQLETAMGSAIGLFEGAEALCVPRSRFAPVKTTSDLLGLWSDCYERTPEDHVRLRQERNGRPPDIELDKTYYKLVDDFEARFPEGAPSLLGCTRLSVKGDVTFEKDVKVEGSVSVIAEQDPMVIAQGTILSG